MKNDYNAYKGLVELLNKKNRLSENSKASFLIDLKKVVLIGRGYAKTDNREKEIHSINSNMERYLEPHDYQVAQLIIKAILNSYDNPDPIHNPITDLAEILTYECPGLLSV